MVVKMKEEIVVEVTVVMVGTIMTLEVTVERSNRTMNPRSGGSCGGKSSGGP